MYEIFLKVINDSALRRPALPCLAFLTHDSYHSVHGIFPIRHVTFAGSIPKGIALNIRQSLAYIYLIKSCRTIPYHAMPRHAMPSLFMSLTDARYSIEKRKVT